MEAQVTMEAACREDGITRSADDASVKPAGFLAAGRLAAFLLVTAVYLVRAVLMHLSRYRDAEPGNSMTHLVMRWARAINRAVGLDVTVRGTPPVETALLVCNHRSYMDVTAIGSCLPVTFLAKKEVGSWPLIGPGCRLVDVVFVERESAASRWRSREEIALRLQRGMSIALFPEGTSHEGPGLLAFRPGVFSLAAAGGFPVVPVALSCERRDDAWVGSDTFIRHFMQTFSRPRVRMTVSFGPVMKGDDPDRLRGSAWRWIDATLKHASVSY